MASAAIARRVSDLVARNVGSEGDVLRFIVLVRKCCEVPARKHQDLSQLRFYLDIPLHAVLDRSSSKGFLKEVEIPVKQIIEAANQAPEGHEVVTPKEHVEALGELVSFARFRALLSAFLRDRGFPDITNDDARWSSFLVAYIRLIAETGTKFRTTSGDLFEASLDAPLIPDDQPRMLAWDWRFKLKNGDTVQLRHSLSIETLLEKDEATVNEVPKEHDPKDSVNRPPLGAQQFISRSLSRYDSNPSIESPASKPGRPVTPRTTGARPREACPQAPVR